MRTLNAAADPTPGDWTRELPIWAVSALDEEAKGWRARYQGSSRTPMDAGQMTVYLTGGLMIYVYKD